MAIAISVTISMWHNTVPPSDPRLIGGLAISPFQATVQEPPIPGLPSGLIIPKIGVDSKIEHLSPQERNTPPFMPLDSQKVAWYSEGRKPGQDGNATIAGRIEEAGKPAPFTNLAALSRGDTVTVAYDDGRQYDFLIDSIKRYTTEQLNSNETAETSKPTLNLVTMDDQVVDDTDHLVVVASLAMPSE